MKKFFIFLFLWANIASAKVLSPSLAVCLVKVSEGDITGLNSSCSNSNTLLENIKNGYKIVSTEPYEKSTTGITIGSTRNEFWIFLQK